MVGGASAQNTFEVTTIGTNYTESQLTDAINNANMCGYYYQDQPRTLYFNDGSIVELKKAAELTSVSTQCVTEIYPNHLEEIWEIAPNGHLIKRMVANPTK